MLYFIVNCTSRSGQGKVTWDKIRRYLKKEQISYRSYQTRYQGHAVVLAERISCEKDEDPCLVIVGGDGTINEVVNGIYKQNALSHVRVGVIPTGSGNDFGNGLNLSKDPIENLKVILENMAYPEKLSRPIDLGLVNGNGPLARRVFAISSGFGMDALVCKLTETSNLKKILNRLHLGFLTYLFLTVYALFSMDTAEMDINYMTFPDYSKTKHFRKVIFTAAMNMRTEGGGVPMAPKGGPEDGLLSICCAHDIPKIVTFFLLPLLVSAKHEGHKGFDITECEEVCAHLNKPMTLHADGECLGEVTEVTYKVLRGALRFLQ